jgi:hypothetical protein
VATPFDLVTVRETFEATMAMHSTTELARLIHKRHQILVQLRDIGQTQSQLIEQGDTPTLLRLLSMKQRVLAGLQAIERELTPFHAEDPDSRAWNSPADRENCAKEAELCQRLLHEVLELERRQEQQLLARRNQAAVELRNVQASREATGAYHAHRWPKSSSPATAARPLASYATPLDVSSEA